MPTATLACLTPSTIQGRQLRNRVAVAPMTRVSATADGFATDRMRRYYRDYARGGFGLVITEGVYTDLEAAQGYDNQPGIATDDQAEAWSAVAADIEIEGALPIMQLMHAGALSQASKRSGPTIAPSAIRPRGRMMPDYGADGLFPLPHPMNRDDIRAVQLAFTHAAERARRAGFRGVEIHGANGYLLDQFNTAYTNLRDDDYGGEPANRIRMTAETVAAIRSATPDDFIVGVRVSEAKVNDFEYRWPGGAAEATTIFRALADAGASYIHVAGEGRAFQHDDEAESFTALARRITGLPVIANGGLHDISLAERVIRDGHADFVALGRAALA
ncbi:MAG: NADH:flavin oxidoreductase, partial [Phycisphaerales bacterium]